MPTPIKIELIRRLVRAGLVNVEATSFVSPKWIPQLADNTEVLRAIAPLLRDTSLRLPVLIPNLRGLDGALGSGVKEVAVFVSASESFSRRNTNCSVEEALERAREVCARAREEGVAVRGWVFLLLLLFTFSFLFALVLLLEKLEEPNQKDMGWLKNMTNIN